MKRFALGLLAGISLVVLVAAVTIQGPITFSSHFSVTGSSVDIPLAGNAQLGLAESDNATLGCTTGVCSINLAHANTWTGAQTFNEVVGTVSTQSGTTYTLAATDCGTEINFTNGSAVSVTIPNSLPAGCNIAIRQGGAGTVSLVAGAGATLNSPHSFTSAYAQNSVIGVSVATNSGGSSAVADFTGDGK